VSRGATIGGDDQSAPVLAVQPHSIGTYAGGSPVAAYSFISSRKSGAMPLGGGRGPQVGLGVEPAPSAVGARPLVLGQERLTCE
jgi:hypothetical protein